MATLQLISYEVPLKTFHEMQNLSGVFSINFSFKEFVVKTPKYRKCNCRNAF